jgi:hypothetical protein
MRWAGLVTRMGEKKMHTVIWLENLKERDHSEDGGVDGKIILKWILGKQSGKVWIEYIWLRIESSGGLL